MSRWLSDFRDEYARHPLSAVGMLAAIILAVTFASAAFAVRFDTPPLLPVHVPASTNVARPAKGQASVGLPTHRPEPVPPTNPPISVYVSESPRNAATLAPSPDSPRPSPRVSRATPTAVQSPSASTVPPTPSAGSPTAIVSTTVTPTPDPTTPTPETS